MPGFECIGTIPPRSRRNGGRLMIKRVSLSNGRSWVWLVLLIVLALAAARQLTLSGLGGARDCARRWGGTYGTACVAHCNRPFQRMGEVAGRCLGRDPAERTRACALSIRQYGFETPLARFFVGWF